LQAQPCPDNNGPSHRHVSTIRHRPSCINRNPSTIESTVCAPWQSSHTHRIALADEPNEAAPDDAAASSLCKWADSSTRLSRSSRKQISTLAVEPHEKKRSFGPVTSGCALEQLSRIQGNAVAVKPRPESALAPAQCSDDQVAYRNRSGGRAPPCGRAAYSARSRAASSTQLHRSAHATRSGGRSAS